VRARLAKEIEGALRLMISTHSERAREDYNSASVKEEMKNFRETRLKEIVTGSTPIRLPVGGKAVLHMIPLPAFFDNRFTDLISSLASGTHIPLPYLGFGHGGVTKTDLDGFVNSNEGVPEHMLSYVKMFRSGAIENVTVLRPNEKGGGCYFFGPDFANKLMTAVTRYLMLLKSYDAGLPVCIMLSLAGGEYHMRYNSMGSLAYRKMQGNNPTITLPLVYAESYDADVPELMRPTLNILWNAFGFPSCDMYANGKYIGVVYPVHVRTRKSFGLMTRKLSVTESRKLAQFLGTLSRKKLSMASAKCPHVA
jgi:hypothetical protein